MSEVLGVVFRCTCGQCLIAEKDDIYGMFTGPRYCPSCNAHIRVSESPKRDRPGVALFIDVLKFTNPPGRRLYYKEYEVSWTR